MKVVAVSEDLGVSLDLSEVLVMVVVWLLVWEMEGALQAVEQEVEVLWTGRGMAADQRNGGLPARKRGLGWGLAGEGAR